MSAVLPDPDRLLWTPGEHTHFLPPAGGWWGVDWGSGDSSVCAFFHNESPSWHGNESIGGPLHIPELRSPDGWAYDIRIDTWTKGDKHITAQFWQEQRGNFQSLDEMAAVMWPERRMHDSVTGLSMRMVREYEPRRAMRMDVLYGHAAVRPDWPVSEIRQAAQALADRIDAHILDLYTSSLDKAMRVTS